MDDGTPDKSKSKLDGGTLSGQPHSPPGVQIPDQYKPSAPKSTQSIDHGFFIGKSSHQEKILEAINTATGGGFVLSNNKLQLNAEFKPTEKHSKKFRKKFIEIINAMKVKVTLHLAKNYWQYNESGKRIIMHLETSGDATTGYSSNLGTDMNIILWADEKLESKLSKEKTAEFVTFRAAILIHEINVHVFTTITNDLRPGYDVMVETKDMLDDGVGVPDHFKKLWGSKPLMRIHDTRMNQDKGKTWKIPAY